MARAGAWVPGVLTSWRGRAVVAAAIGAVGLAAAVPAVARAGAAAPAGPRVIATTAVGSLPSGLAVNPRTGTVYILNNYSGSPVNRVAVLNPRTNKLTSTVPINGANPVSQLAVLGISPASGDVYVDGAYNGRWQSWIGGGVTVISGRTGKIITSIPFHHPYLGAVSPVTGDFYVANTKANNSNTVSVINGDKVVATIGVPYVWSMGVSPRTGDAYVTAGPSMTVLSGRTNKIIATLHDVSYPATAISPATGKVYIEGGGCDPHNSPACTGHVSVISGQTNKVLADDSLTSNPGQIAFGPRNGDVYVSTGNLSVADANSDVITVISGQTNKIIGNIEFPGCAASAPTQAAPFAISPRTGNLYVPITSGTNCRTYSVQEVSGQTGKIIGAVQLPTPGRLAAANPVNDEVYVLRPQSGNSSGPYVASVIAG